MSHDFFADVRDFAVKFGQPAPDDGELPALDLWNLRDGLIDEEHDELRAAYGADDIEGFADALADLTYVVIGTAVASGIDIRPVWNEVHRTNMLKEGGAVRDDGKILKPAYWKAPDIREALSNGRPRRRMANYNQVDMERARQAGWDAAIRSRKD